MHFSLSAHPQPVRSRAKPIKTSQRRGGTYSSVLMLPRDKQSPSCSWEEEIHVGCSISSKRLPREKRKLAQSQYHC